MLNKIKEGKKKVEGKEIKDRNQDRKKEKEKEKRSSSSYKLTFISHITSKDSIIFIIIWQFHFTYSYT